MTALTDYDRRILARSAELAELRTTAAVTERFPGWGDSTAAAYAEAFGVARYLLAELAGIVERLDGDEDQGDEDTRRLDRIRVVLAKFDWEHDDRQLALEAIERITEGGQA